MRSASIAEWIVGRFTDRRRASAIVGDLVEVGPQKGLLWFWISLIGVTVCLSWRSGLRLAAAFFVRNVAFVALFSASFFHLQHSPPGLLWLSALNASSSVCAFLWMVLTYAGIRYGLRDKVTRLALAWASVATVAICFWREPVILFLCLVVGIWMVSASISKIRYRQATLVLLGTVVTGYASARLVGYLDMLSLRFLLYSGRMNSYEHLLMLASESLIVTWIAIMVCSRMHRGLLESKPLDEEVEENLA